MEEGQCTTSVQDINSGYLTLKNQSIRLKLLGSGFVVEAHHLCNAESGAEFACMHNCDGADFMN